MEPRSIQLYFIIFSTTSHKFKYLVVLIYGDGNADHPVPIDKLKAAITAYADSSMNTDFKQFYELLKATPLSADELALLTGFNDILVFNKITTPEAPLTCSNERVILSI